MWGFYFYLLGNILFCPFLRKIFYFVLWYEKYFIFFPVTKFFFLFLVRKYFFFVSCYEIFFFVPYEIFYFCSLRNIFFCPLLPIIFFVPCYEKYLILSELQSMNLSLNTMIITKYDFLLYIKKFILEEKFIWLCSLHYHILCTCQG